MRRRPPGRPAWEPTALNIEQAKVAAQSGQTKEQIALATLGCAASTLYAYLAAHPESELSEALKKGRAIGVGLVAGKLFQQAMNDNDPKAVSARIFYLKAIGGWTDRVEVTGDPAQPLVTANAVIRFSPRERKELRRVLAEAVGGSSGNGHKRNGGNGHS